MVTRYKINVNNINCILELNSKKMKSIRMSIQYDNTNKVCIIRVNGYRITYDIALKMINDHQNWVNKRLTEIEKKNNLFEIEKTKNLNIIYLYGIPYEVVITDQKNNHLQIIGNNLYSYSKNGYISNPDKALDFIRTAFLGRITELFNKYNLIFKRNTVLKYKSMKSRHGYCLYKENIICLSTHLVHVPMYAIEYVIIHEFCHFIEPNHSKMFYNEVEKYCKDYKDRIKVLKEYNVLTI